MDTNDSNAGAAQRTASPIDARMRSAASTWHASLAPSIDDVIGGGMLLTMLCAIGVLIVDGSRLLTA